MNRYLFICSLFFLSGIFSTGISLSAETTPAAQLSLAQKLATKGNFVAAKGILNRLISQFPSAPEPYNNLAALEAQQGNIEAAQSLLEKALRTSPGHQLSYQNLNALNQSIALQAYKKSLALKAPKQSLQLSTSKQIALAANTEVKIVEKRIEVVKEVVRERIVEVAADCPATAVIEKACDRQSGVSSNYPDPANIVHSWAKAWSEKDTVSYINHYTRDYSHAENKSHVDWVTLRRQRLAQPKYIRVKTQHLRTQRLNDTAASVQFLQHYQSDTINDSIQKTLLLVIEDGQWKIQQELVLR